MLLARPEKDHQDQQDRKEKGQPKDNFREIGVQQKKALCWLSKKAPAISRLEKIMLRDNLLIVPRS